MHTAAGGEIHRRLNAAGRSINVDRLDSCSETHLGLCATCCVTLTIWIVAIPVFDIMGMSWIQGWEGPTTIAPPSTISYDDLLERCQVVNIQEQGKLSFPGAAKPEDVAAATAKVSGGVHFGFGSVEDAHSFATDKLVVGPVSQAIAGTLGVPATAVTVTMTPAPAPVASRRLQAESTSVEGNFVVDVPSGMDPCAAASAASALSANPSDFLAQVSKSMGFMKYKPTSSSIANIETHSAFTALDADDDGGVDVANIESSALNVTTDQAEFIVNRFDTNGDYAISCSEMAVGLSAGSFVAIRPSTTAPPTTTTGTVPAGSTAKVETTRAAAATTTLAPTTKPPMVEIPANPLVTQFRLDAIQWGGTMEKACAGFYTAGVGVGNLNLGNFTAGVLALTTPPQPPYTAAQAQQIFELLDADHDDILTPMECYLSPNYFMEMVSKSDPEQLFNAADADKNEKISAKEFVAFGHLLQPPISEVLMLKLMGEMDKNKDAFIEKDEFMTGTGVAPSILADGTQLSDKEMEAYKGVPATVRGLTEMQLEIPAGKHALRPMPNHTVISNIVKLRFIHAFEEYFASSHEGFEFTIGSVQTVGEEMNEAGGAVDEGTGVVNHMRRVAIAWESQTNDGGSFQSMLKKDANDMFESFLQRLNAIPMEGISGEVNAETWSRCTFMYYGNKAASVPRGTRIKQTFGTKSTIATGPAAPPSAV